MADTGTKEIRLVEYDPSWPEQFAEHAAIIAEALGDRALQIEHIGSTSVPGLAAKPKIDILLVVPSSADESSYVPQMEAAGYELRIREPDFEEHRMFSPPDRRANIHVVSAGSIEIERWLIFRDRLRRHADDRQLYERTKKDLARRRWRDTDAYAEAKSEVIERIIAAARTVLGGLVAALLVGLSPGVAGAQATVEDSAAVGARIDAYRTAWDTHDASALAAFFTDDADFVMGNQPAAVGRRAIQEWWSDYFSNQEPERHLGLDVHSVRFVTADVAVVTVTTTTGGRDNQGRKLLARRFRGTWVLHRRSGEWRISAMRGLPTEEDRMVLNESPAVMEKLRPEIRALIHRYEDAWDRHDPSAVSAFYRDDADIIVRNGPVTHGRQAIADWWASYFAQPRLYRATLIVRDIRMVTPDVALVNVVAAGAALEQAHEPVPARYARATWLLTRQDGRWLVSALWILPSEDDRIIRGGGG